jgi:hypothetical protein
VALIQAWMDASPHRPTARMPFAAKTIHNGPRDSIDAVQESALQLVRDWLLCLLRVDVLAQRE